jgi:hypothetical protein
MPSTKIIVKRILISLLLGLLLGVAIGEIPFLFLRETARAPKEIVLTIPAGTAERVSRGEQPPSIPQNMIFVVGDILLVDNQDVVDLSWPVVDSCELVCSVINEKESFALNAPSNQKLFRPDVRTAALSTAYGIHMQSSHRNTNCVVQFSNTQRIRMPCLHASASGCYHSARVLGRCAYRHLQPTGLILRKQCAG